MTPEERAAKATSIIEADILDRRGLKRDWRAIDEDVRATILAVWGETIAAAIREAEACAAADALERAAEMLGKAIDDRDGFVAVYNRLHALADETRKGGGR